MGTDVFPILKPTFTQGLVLGQISVLLLLGLILKYLFLDTSQPPPVRTETREENGDPVAIDEKQRSAESTEWFNTVVQKIVDVYRTKLRSNLNGLEGDEIARQRIEAFANGVIPPGLLDYVKIHSVDLGVSAPRLSNARLSSRIQHDLCSEIEFDMTYTDTISVSLSTSYLFHHPRPYFLRLPVSLSISLSLFKASLKLVTPSPALPDPTLNIYIAPDFTLDLNTTSLMGSRAKLADVRKIHELIQLQVRRIIAGQGNLKIPFPGLGDILGGSRPS